MRRLCLVLQYDGTKFNGWQVQRDQRTVQGTVEHALQVLLHEQVSTITSGRTDTGVHAWGQVIHLDTSNPIDLRRLCAGMNGILERDVGVDNAYEASPDFHARFSAVEREYLYCIYNNPTPSPFMRHRALWVRPSLDTGYLQAALQHLVGERDFASFCKKESAHEGTVRRINAIEVSRRGPLVTIHIRGNAFLHNMIRIIVGTALQLHAQRLPHDRMADICAQQNRDASGITAPAHGLYLLRVRYDPPLDSLPAAHTTIPVHYAEIHPFL